MVEIVANLHMHSPYSDGESFHREIAAAAAKTKIDAVIVTDHNVWVRGIDGYFDDVLVLTGEEVHNPQRLPQVNHCLIYDTNDEMAPFASNPHTLVNEAAKRGGLAFFAHPIERGSPLSADYAAIPWVDWDVPNMTGIELWNYMTEFKARLWSWPAAALYALFPSLVIFGPFVETLRKWDELLADGKRVNIIGNSDAHGTPFNFGPIQHTVFAYEYLFRCVNTHLLLDRPLQRDVARDKAMIYDALKAGRCFVGYDLISSTRGFSFTARSGSDLVQMGGKIDRRGATRFEIRCPSAGFIRLVCNGKTVISKYGTSLDHMSAEPGVYRVEVKKLFRLWLRGWIYSNPIYVS